MKVRLSLVGARTPSSHEFGAEGGIFGRSRKCDWVLPDDERVLSAIHGRIVLNNDEFILVDESSNGIFVDGMQQPLGRGNSTILYSGLRFHAGRFHIEVQIQPASARMPAAHGPRLEPGAAHVHPAAGSTAETALRDRGEYGGVWGQNSQDPLNYIGSGGGAAPGGAPASSPSTPPRGASRPATLPSGDELARALDAELSPPAAPAASPPGAPNPVGPDPVGPDPAGPARSPGPPPAPQPPAGAGDPSPASGQIPEDFLSRLGPVNNAAGTARPSRQQPPDASPSGLPDGFEPTSLVSGEEANGEAPAPSPPQPRAAALSPELLADLVEPGAAREAPPDAAGPAAMDSIEALKTRREQRKAALLAKSAPSAGIPSAGVPPGAAAGGPAASPAAAPSPAPPGPIAPPAGAPDDAALVRTLLESMGFPATQVAPEDREQLMRDVGTMVREVAAGLILILTARRIVKNEFRLDETRIEPEENNPFKVFKVPELALDELLFTRSGGFQEPAEATKAAFQDIQQHTMVMMSAMQQSIRTLFERLSPDAVASEEEADDSGLRIRGRGGRRDKWETYRESHARMSNNLSTVTRQILAEAFARVEDEQARRQAGSHWEKKP